MESSDIIDQNNVKPYSGTREKHLPKLENVKENEAKRETDKKHGTFAVGTGAYGTTNMNEEAGPNPADEVCKLQI